MDLSHDHDRSTYRRRRIRERGPDRTIGPPAGTRGTVIGGDCLTAGGGKGANQAIAIRRLGGMVSFVARIGDDDPGRRIESSLKAEGLDLAALTVDKQAPTGVALIMVDQSGQNMISVAPGANGRLSPNDVRQADTLIRRADVLVVQLEVPLDTVRAALEAARASGVMTVLNPAPARQVSSELLALVDWLTPNEFEASTLTGVAVADANDAIEAGRILLDRGAQNVVITLGSRGAIYLTKTAIERIDPFQVAAIDTVAAGDAFTGGLAVSLARRRSVGDSLAFASAAGALATTRRGAQPSLPTESDVDRLIATRAVSVRG